MARVLIACEESGTVRDAFTAAGHIAVSCDLKPSRTPGLHYQGDIFDILDDGWDLMIGHPVCQYLANAGFFHVYWTESKTPGVLVGHDRWKALIDGAVFFRRLLEAPIPRVAIENPTMVGWAQKIIGSGPTQTIQPWDFGHKETKRTGLWLRNLPPLVPTADLKAETMALPYKQRARIHYASPGPKRAELRSVTYPGIAAAMAAQWGPLLDADPGLSYQPGDDTPIRTSKQATA